MLPAFPRMVTNLSKDGYLSFPEWSPTSPTMLIYTPQDGHPHDGQVGNT